MHVFGLEKAGRGKKPHTSFRFYKQVFSEKESCVPESIILSQLERLALFFLQEIDCRK